MAVRAAAARMLSPLRVLICVIVPRGPTVASNLTSPLMPRCNANCGVGGAGWVMGIGSRTTGAGEVAAVAAGFSPGLSPGFRAGGAGDGGAICPGADGRPGAL